MFIVRYAGTSNYANVDAWNLIADTGFPTTSGLSHFRTQIERAASNEKLNNASGECIVKITCSKGNRKL